MKPALQLKLSQHLTLTPQLQQSIRLLQLSTLELKQELENYLRENPFLEREDEIPESSAANGAVTDFSAAGGEPRAADARNERDERDDMNREAEASSPVDRDEEAWGGDGAYGEEPYFSSSASGAADDDDRDFQEIQAAASKLADHLSWQLGLTPLSDRDRILVRMLIESLDEDGYLTLSLEELAQMLPDEIGVEPEELRAALGILQHFDPAGVGARNAQECLLLQLAARRAEEGVSEERGENGAGDGAFDRIYDLAREIISGHLEQLAARDFASLKKLAGGDEETLRAAHRLILSLNPRPGAQYATLEARYITPDVVVKKIRGEWLAQINSAAYPRLRVNRLYADICAGQRGSALSGQLQEARWLLKNVQQRFDTIIRVAQEIVRRQRGFFDYGEVAMRPLILREIAETLGLHESTISRVTTQKYMATPRGIFELKYFFGSHVATDVGGACSATAIRALIKQLIAAENKKKPISDNKITEILGQQGIVVARRTVAKYREMLNIPPANLRKSL